MINRLTPLRGHVFVRMLPPPKQTAAGFFLPDKFPDSPEKVQMSHRNPVKPPGEFGIVEAIGPWPIINGRYHPPQFKVGMQIVVPRGAGREFSRGVRDVLRIVRYDQVLAEVDTEQDLDAPESAWVGHSRIGLGS
jgi:co-chaperonin GroES (HSP10)